MLENGYIKAHRSLLNWGWFRDPYTAHLWEYLRLAANWDEREFKGIKISRGQLVTSYPSMAEATGLSQQSVRTAIKHLKQTGEITMKSYRDFSVITIANYEKYQSDEGKPEANQGQLSNRQLTDYQQATNSQLTGCQQAANRQLTTNEESKKARRQESKKREGDISEKFQGEMLKAVQRWLAYKAERKENYQPTGLESLLTQISNRVKQHGERAVIDCIELSMANNWRGIIWDRIKTQSVDNTNAKHDVQGELTDWEKEWLQDMERRKKEREEGKA